MWAGRCAGLGLIGGLLTPLAGYTAQPGTLPLGAVAFCLPMVAVVLVTLLGMHRADWRANALMGKRSLAVGLGGVHRRFIGASRR